MKRTIKMLAFAAVAVGLVFASCKKEDVDDVASSSNSSGDNGGGQPVFDDYVDLGLPSGLLWATCNIGATRPEQIGEYYAWGETEVKGVYNWSTYKYCTVDEVGNVATLTKYNTSPDYGITDNLTTMEAIDDVATQMLGNGARIPTVAEWEELISNTTVEWTAMNGVKGRKFTAANGNSLFLPAAGSCWGNDVDYVGKCGYYWSSTLYATYPKNVFQLGFSYDEDDVGTMTASRYIGRSVRPVRSTQ